MAKKKSNAKKAREEQSGRSGARQSTLEEDVVGYFVRVGNLIDAATVEDEEEHASLVANVYAEAAGIERKVAQDKSASRTLELALKYFTPTQVVGLMRAYDGHFRKLMCHPCSSHVMERLLEAVAGVVDNAGNADDYFETEGDEGGEDENSSPPSAVAEELVIKMTSELTQGFEEVMSDRWGSHTLRKLFGILSGREAVDKHNTKRVHRYRPDSFKRALNEYVDNILGQCAEEPEYLPSFGFHNTASATLQVLLDALGPSEQGQALTHSLLRLPLDHGEGTLPAVSSEHINSLMKDKFGSHLMESILRNADENILSQLYTQVFRGNLLELCKHQSSNFAVQHMILHLAYSPQVELVFEELQGSISDLWRNWRSGIILRLVQACLKHQVKQKDLCKVLRKAVVDENETGEEVFAKRLLTTQSDDKRQSTSQYCSANGALIVENMLKFNEDTVKLLLDSFLKLSSEHVTGMAKHAQGSRVVEAFLEGKAATAKRKRKLIDLLEGNFAILAADKYGSHCVDKCFLQADVTRKERIVAELLAAESTLEGNRFGQFTLTNCRVREYKTKKDKWVATEEGKENKVRVFQDILEDDGTIAEPIETEAEEKKKKKKGDNEIDELFKDRKEKRVSKRKQRENEAKDADTNAANAPAENDETMMAIMDAITNTTKKGKKKKSKQDEEDGNDSKKPKKKKPKFMFA